MVSTSRKKNKGKQRKAKKVETERAWRSKVYEDWLGWAKGEKLVKNVQCKHGRDCILPNDSDHPVSSFMHDFITYRDDDNKKAYTVVEMMRDTFQTHPNVWNDNRYREMVVNILTRIGTNMELVEIVLNKDKGMLWALRIAKTIAVLENYDGGGSLVTVIQSRKVQTKLRELDISVSSNRRDLLKFFSKRVSCLCLKKMHQEARKTIFKTGMCWHCMNEKKRVDLSVCSRCMIEQYCSRECQVADWPDHKEDCESFIKAHVGPRLRGLFNESKGESGSLTQKEDLRIHT